MTVKYRFTSRFARLLDCARNRCWRCWKQNLKKKWWREEWKKDTGVRNWERKWEKSAKAAEKNRGKRNTDIYLWTRRPRTAFDSHWISWHLHTARHRRTELLRIEARAWTLERVRIISTMITKSYLPRGRFIRVRVFVVLINRVRFLHVTEYPIKKTTGYERASERGERERERGGKRETE